MICVHVYVHTRWPGFIVAGYIKYMEEKMMEENNLLQFISVKPTHAGGLVYRLVNGQKEYLLVSSKNVALAWVLPKGQIDENETAEQAALREIKEEAGVEGVIVQRLGVVSTIRWPFKRKIITFYLVEMKAAGAANEEHRETVWLPFEQAYAKLTYAYQKRVMKKLKI